MSKKDFYIYLDGRAIRVSEEVYRVYTRGERKERYFMEDLKTERIKVDPEAGTVHIIPSREDSYERLMAINHQFMAQGQSVEDEAVLSVLLEKAMRSLSDEEQALIHELFYLEKTEREVSTILNIARSTLQRKRNRVLEKLRGMLEK